MTVRIGSVWDSTQQVLAGRTGMLAPFAAIGFVLPVILQLLLVPQTTMANMSAGASVTGLLVTLVAIGLGIWAQLAIMALATHPATTSAEASRAGLRRLLPLLGVAVVLGLVFALVVLVPVVVLGVSGFDFARAIAAQGNPALMPPMPPGAGLFVILYGLTAFILAFWVMARLMLTYAVVLNERRGLGAIRRSITLTRGMTWRLIGVTILFVILVFVTTAAAQGVTAIAFRLILGSGHQALVIGLASLVGSIVSAGFMTLAYVFIARLYVAAAGVPVVEAAEVTEDGSPTL
ncbi:putative membrane protein [Sphingomonas sp. S17]|uniref:DNA, contig: SP658 n=1 Tax=Sphingomonas paucimobilis NBRC 13935 TaxID=1219050 RepID=A0A0C9MXX1_SPHPI|nr:MULTISPECIES: hypothetical protein [Sphingomonas]EGI53219.1 putative membrane protein [Sphingomonas sp. S17]MCM3679932.1 hypothetical protein [Sphingomonas paucimobilis]MDG5970673.1 hypothetical protein [Sphingomonas paucimobilis]SUJ36708.1 Uncharacterised protein [Sphingomonas paucimobilis]BCI72280.1 hypothetical protein SPKIRA_31100 [Sphingomonas paucimobilis]